MDISSDDGRKYARDNNLFELKCNELVKVHVIFSKKWAFEFLRYPGLVFRFMEIDCYDLKSDFLIAYCNNFYIII
jgi:hypothetical protein